MLRSKQHFQSRSPWYVKNQKWRHRVLLGFVLLLTAEAVLLWLKWPFTRERLTVSLERATGSKLRAARFRMTFFPSPGCVINEAVFERDGAGAPLARMRQLSVRGSWASVLMLQHHLAEMQPEDLHVTIPDKVPPAMRLHPPAKHETGVGKFVADGAVLEVRGLMFRFRRLRVHDLSRTSAIRLETEVALPHPSGTAQRPRFSARGKERRRRCQDRSQSRARIYQSMNSWKGSCRQPASSRAL